MKIVRSDQIEYQASSHEDKINPGIIKKILLKREDLKEDKIQMINWAKLKKGRGFVAHYHEDMEEVFIILDGCAQFRINDEVEDLYPGDLVIVPKRSVHEMKNIDSKDIHYLTIGISGKAHGKTVVSK